MKYHTPGPLRTNNNKKRKKINIENLKRIVSEKKTRLPLLRNHDWRTVKAETEKIKEFVAHISTNNITELNEQIYAEVDSVYEKIGVSI